MLQSSSSSSEEELSVHFQMIPRSQRSSVNEDIECAIVAVQTYPLPEFVLIHKDESVLKDIESLENFRLNVYKVTLSQDRELYDVELHAEPNYPTLGKKFGVKSIAEKIRQMTDTDIEKLLSKGESESPLIIIDDVPIESEGVHFFFRVVKQTQFEAIAKQGCVVLLDYTADAALKDEGRIQEITSRIQKLRKEAFFYVNY
ncbi:unnamed protein product [Rotaria sp. Silwood1]|nr:unnamed protein product [Rotaria sp. Silwood1]CAF4881739.1 unnamed protein product [Rotaria sp. Silwood1]